MIKYNGEIVHLGNKSLYEFLKEYPGEIVLYGLGEEGTIAYNALAKHEIELAAIADGDVKKQGTNLNEHTILSMDELINSTPKNALVWVTIAKKEIAQSVMDSFAAAGFENIINAMIKDPVGLCDFSEFDTGLPATIVGANDLGRRIQKHLNENGVDVLCYCDTDTDLREYCGLPVKAIGEVLGAYERINVIICADNRYRGVTTELKEHCVMGNAYRGIVSGIGEFRIHKYLQDNMIIGKVMLYLLSHTNAIYFSQKSEETREIFKTAVQEGLRGLKETYSKQRQNLDDDSRVELWKIKDEQIEKKMGFRDVCEDLMEFVRFFATMKLLCIDEGSQVTLLQEGNNIQVV